MDNEPEVGVVLKELYNAMKKNSEKNKKYAKYIHNIIKMGDRIMISGEEIVSYKEFMRKIKNDDRVGKQLINIINKIENTLVKKKSVVKRIMKMFIDIAELYFYVYDDEEKQLTNKQVYVTSSETLKLHFYVMKTIFITVVQRLICNPKVMIF